MATNNIAMYFKNVGKSVQYAAVDVFKEKFESSSSFVDSNKDLFKEVYAAAKDYKNTIDKASGVIASSKIYKAADQAKINILESIKTGKFYDKEREDAMATAAMGELGNFDDMDMDIEDFDFESDQVNRVKKSSTKTDDSDIISSAIRASSQVSTEALANVTVRTGEYIVESNRANNKILQAQNDFLIKSVNSGFTNMVNSIGTINSNLEAVSILADNSKKFFESTSGKLDAMLKVMVEMNDRQSKIMNPPTQEKKEKVGYDDITTNGMPDIKEYLKQVAKNAKNAGGPMGDMLFGNSFGEDSNMLMTFAANPLSFIPKLLINMVIPKNLEKAAKSLDNTVSGLFANMIAQFNRMSKDENPIFQKIGEIFGIKNNAKTTLDPSKYNKGAVPFDGIVKKSIIEVIPGYLRRIEKLLGGSDERLFNFDSGKWTSATEVSKDLKNIKKGNISSAFSDVMPYLKEMMDSVRAKDKAQYDDFNKNLDTMLEGIWNNFGSFRFNDKKLDEKYSEYGASSPDQMKMLREAFKNLPKEHVVQLAGKVMSGRANQTKQMERLEADAHSPLMALFNNGIDQKDIDRLTGLNAGKTGAKYKPVNVLTESRDGKGNNVFNYLDNILSELMIIRSLSTRGSSPSGDGSGSPGGGPSPIPSGDNVLNGLSLIDDKGMPIVQSLSPVRHTDAQEKAIKDKKAAQERYIKDRQRAILKGTVTDTDIGNGIYIDPADASKYRGTFGLMAAKRDRKDAKEMDESDSILQKWIRDNKKDDTKSEDGKKNSLFDQLTKAQGLSEKWNVIKENMATLLDKPGQMLTSMIQSADKRLYQLMFGKNMGTGIDGEPIKGFADMMVNELKKTFEKVNDWIDTGLASLKKKLGIDSFGELFTKLLDKVGLNEERRSAIKNKVKEWASPYIESTKKTFKGAIDYTRDAVNETSRDLRFGSGGQEITDASKAIMDRLQRKALDKFSQKWKSDPANAERTEDDMKRDFYNSPMFKATKRYSDTARGTAREKVDSKYKAKADAKALESFIEKWKSDPANANKSEDDMKKAFSDSRKTKEEKYKEALKAKTDEMTAKIKERAKNKAQAPKEDENGQQIISGYAKGARYIKKSGITAISEGEMIIPAEYNPFNPNADKVDKKKEKTNEKKLANNFLENIAENMKFNSDGNDLINGTNNRKKKGETVEVGPDFTDSIKQEAKQVGREIKDAGLRIIYGDEKKDADAVKKAMSDVGAHIKEYAPDAFSHGLLGGVLGTGVSLLTGVVGGPLLGAAAGAAVGIVKKSDAMQNWLFGEYGSDGEREGGVFSKKLQGNFKKYFPSMKNYGLTGALAGMLTPLGPIGGLLVGSTIGFMKKNDNVANYLFGTMNEKTGQRDENGLISKGTQEAIKKGLPRAALGAAAGLFMGPFGLIGNAAVGAGLGMLTSTDKFQDVVFGPKNDKGEREGGLVGAIHDGIVVPIKDALTGFKDSFLEFMHDKVMDPLERFMEPVGQDIKNMFISIGDSVSNFLNNRFEKSLGVPLDQFVKEKFLSPLGNFVGTFLKASMKPLKWTIGAPFAMLGAYGDSRRRSQIKDAKAIDMTAEDRLEFMHKKPGMINKMLGRTGYKTEEFDKTLAGIDEDQLSEMESLLMDAVGGKKIFSQKIGDERHGMTNDTIEFIRKNKLDKTMDYKRRNKMLEAAGTGDLAKIKKILNSTGKNGKKLDEDIQDELYEALEGRSKSITNLQNRKENAGREKDVIFNQLSKLGLKGITEDNQAWYLRNISTEKKARKKNGMLDPAEAGDPVLAAIQQKEIDEAKKNADNIINKLNELKSIFKYFTGIDENGKKIEDPAKVLITGSDGGSTYTDGEIGRQIQDRNRQNKKVSKLDAKIKGKRKKNISEVAQDAADEANSNIIENDSETKTAVVESSTPKKKSAVSRVIDTIFGSKRVEENNKGDVAVADDPESKEVELAQKNFRSILIGKASKVPIFGKFLSKLFGAKDEDKKEKKEGEEDDEDSGGGFLSRMIKSKPFKAIAGIVGGITGVAVLGHVGKFWDTKAWPAITNFFETNKFGEKILKGITDLKDSIVGTFMNALDWFSGGAINGTYKDAGFPYLFREGVVPFYVNGIGYFLEHMLPATVGLLLKALPSILDGAIKGLGKIFSMSLSTMFGREKYTKNMDSSYEISAKSGADVLQQSFTKSNGGTSQTESGDWLKRHFGSAVSSYDKSFTGNDFTVTGNANEYKSNIKTGVTSYYDPATGTTSYSYVTNEGDSVPIDEAFKQGLISEEEFKKALINIGMTPEKAEEYINNLKQSGMVSSNGTINQNLLPRSDDDTTLPIGNLALNGQEKSLGSDLLEGLARAPFSRLGGQTISSAGKLISHIPFVGKYAGGALNKYGKFATAMNKKAGTFGAAAATRAASAGADDAARLAATQAARAGQSLIGNSGDEMAEYITKTLAENGVKLNVKGGAYMAQQGTGVKVADKIQDLLGVGKKAAEEMASGKMTIEALEKVAAETSDDVLKGIVGRAASANAVNPGIATKILKGIEKALGKIFGEDSFIMKKIASSVAKSTGDDLLRAAAKSNAAGKTVVAKILAACKGAGSKLLTAGSKFLQAALPFINIAFLVYDFTTGFDNAAGMLGVLPEDVNLGQRVICGLLKVVNGKITLGIIPETFLVDIFVSVLGPLFDIDLEEFKAERAKAEEAVIAWNESHPDEQYETVQTFANKDTFTTKLGNGIKKVGSTIKSGWDTVIGWFTGGANKAADSVQKAGSTAAGYVYATGAKVSKTVAAEQDMIKNGVDPTSIGSGQMSMSVDTATGTPFYMDVNTGMQYNLDGTVREVGLGRGDGAYEPDPASLTYSNNLTNDYQTTASAATGVTPTTATLDVSSILSKVSIDEKSQERAVNSINKLMNNTINIWNDNLKAVTDIITDEKFITTEAVFNDEYKNTLKENLINNIRYGIGNAWDVAQAAALAQWNKIFGQDALDKNNAAVGTGAFAASAVGTGALIGTAINPGLGTAIGAGIGALIGGGAMLINKFVGDNKEYDAISDKTKNAVNGLSNTMLNIYNEKLVATTSWIEEMRASTDLLTSEHKDALIKTTKDGLIGAIGKAWGVAAALATNQWDTIFGIDSSRGTAVTVVGTAIGAGMGAKVGAGLGTLIAPGIGTAIGAGLGAGIGWLVTKFVQKEVDYSAIEESTKTSVNTIKNDMISLYNEKLIATSGWIGEMRKSTDLLTSEHKDALVIVTKEKLSEAIGKAWGAAASLASNQWDTFFGIDSSRKDAGTALGVVAGAGLGIAGAKVGATIGMIGGPIGMAIGAGLGAGLGFLVSKFIQKEVDYSAIEESTKTSVNTLMNSMLSLYNEKLVSTTGWINEMRKSTDLLTSEHKEIMTTLTKSNLASAIGVAWGVSEKLAISQWNKSLGIDPGFNFLNGFKNLVGNVSNGIASMGAGALFAPGVILGTGIGVFGTIMDGIDAATQIDTGSKDTIDLLMSKMTGLYNSKLISTTAWIDEMAVSTDLMTTDHKNKMVSLTKSNLINAIGNAWGVSEELALAQWNKALGLDKGYNFWNDLKDVAAAGAAGAAGGAVVGTMIAPGIGSLIGAGGGALTGVIGSILAKIDENNTVNPEAEAGITNLINNMQTLYTTGLTTSNSWLDVIKSDTTFMSEYDKNILINGAKYKLRGAIGGAWGVAAELAQAKWNKCLGLDTSFNFWSAVEENGASVAASAGTGALVGTMICPGLGTAVGAAIGAGVGWIGSLWKSITKDQEEVEKSPTATAINTLISSMETLWTTNLISSTGILTDTKKFNLTEAQKTLLIDDTKAKLTEEVATAWGVANELTVKKFNQALGLDLGFNFFKTIKESGVVNGANIALTMVNPVLGAINAGMGIIGHIWNSADFNTDDEVTKSVSNLVNKFEEVWTLKLNATTGMLDAAKTDYNFVDKYDKENLIDTTKSGLGEMLSTVWGAAANITKNKWNRAVNWYVASKTYSNDMSNTYGYYGSTNTTTLTDTEKEEYKNQINGIDEVAKLIDEVWIDKLNNMLSIVNAGSVGDIDLVSESAGVDWEPINDGLKNIDSYYDNIKINFKDNKTNFKNYATGAPKSSESFSGVKNLMYYTKKLYGVVPLLFNKTTYDSAEQYKKYYDTLSTGLTYVNTVEKSTTDELNKITVNTKFDKLFKTPNFNDPIKNIIHMTEKILSFPLYMSKYMTKKIEKLFNDNDALNFLGTFDKFANAIEKGKNGPSPKNPYIKGGLGSGIGDKPAPSNGAAFGDVVNQVDGGIANIPYGTTADGIQQNIGNSGCAPVNATNIINDIYGKGTISVKNAADYALKHKYKDNNGGTTIDYFNGILNDYGIKSSISTDKKDIVNSINSNKPVVLLGKDGSFGNSPHYMTVTGIDNNGNAVVMDPNTKNEYDSYKMSSLLQNSMGSVNIDPTNIPFAPPKQATSGFGKFKRRMSGYGRRAIRVLSGYGTQISDDQIASIAAEIISKSEGNYGSINANDNGSMSIGKVQWNANAGRALPLLKSVVALNPSKAKITLGDALYYEIVNSSPSGWNRAGRKATSSEKTKLSALLSSTEGIKAQNSLIAVDVPGYIKKGREIGINDVPALIYFADLANQYGTQTAANKIKNVSKNLESIHGVFVNSEYAARRGKCYQMCLNWQSYSGLNLSSGGVTANNADVTIGSTSNENNDTIGNIGDFFSKLNLNLVKDIYGEDNYNLLYGQQENSNNTSTIDNNGNPITGTVNAGMANNFPYFSQLDPKWANYNYTNPSKGASKGTIGTHGCGATSLAMVAQSYGINATPPTIADYSMSHGGVNYGGGGSNHSLFTNYASDNGLTVTNPVGINGVVNSLKNKIPVIVGHGPGQFTKGGHLLVASGLDKEGNIMVNDPASVSRTEKHYTPNNFAETMKSRFAFSKNGVGSIDNIKTIGGMGSGPSTVRNDLLSGYGPGTTKSPELIENTVKQPSVHTTANTTNKTEVINSNINYTKFLIKVVEILTSVSNNTEVLNSILKFMNDNLKTNISSTDVKKMASVDREKAAKNLSNNALSNGALQSLGNNSGSSNESPTNNKNLDYILNTMTSIAKE